MALPLLTHEKLQNTFLEFTTLDYEVHSQCLCTGGFKFPYHTHVHLIYWTRIGCQAIADVTSHAHRPAF